MTTSRLLQRLIAACLATALMVTAVSAQPPGGGRGGPGRGGPRFGGEPRMPLSRAQLVNLEDVQAEIKIDDGQAATITAALEAFREERRASRPDFGSFRDMSEEERAKALEKVRKYMEDLSKKNDEVLNALLEPEQIERLDQIMVQLQLRMGPSAALKSPEMRDKLSITDEQLTKLEGVEKEAEEARRKMFEEMRAGGRDRAEGQRPDFRAIMEKAREEQNTKVMAVLNDTQRKKLDELKGKEFNLDMRSLMRGGRGGDAGRGRGRGGDGGEGGRGRGRGGEGGRRPAQDSDGAI